ncbi:phosphate signaling complex PhoU family protein [Paractinoplanes lichenicola]|uniref:Phosphate transport system regulatory protein PhoU n=1 Tax=Paractinoplanes lichenicola TaxID=2802976 RepID=A0ABS1VXX3_9ACTN|nr:PhoU domain-containing protein [Actinoplanes lichenicola]MBL7259302.1 phosphate transport system regulatory protein PhoU [Actinoplanes lichenicola]
MPQGFHGDLAQVGGTLVTMAKAARETMRQASQALLAADHTSAQQVIERGAEINVLFRLVEDRVYDLVGRRKLGPDELPATMTAVQVAADLERMSELAVHVARSSLRRHPAPAVAPELTGLFTTMSEVADRLAEKMVDVLADHDAELAAGLDQDDDAMDQLHRRLFAVMLSPDWPLGVEAAVDGALLGRFYERYADHAVNVANRVVELTRADNGIRSSN